MYGINRCPRCGGHRLPKPLAGEIFVMCVGCGLMTDEPEFPGAPNPTPHRRTTVVVYPFVPGPIDADQRRCYR